MKRRTLKNFCKQWNNNLCELCNKIIFILIFTGMLIRLMPSSWRILITFTWVLYHTLLERAFWTVPFMQLFLCIKWDRCLCMIYIRCVLFSWTKFCLKLYAFSVKMFLNFFYWNFRYLVYICIHNLFGTYTYFSQSLVSPQYRRLQCVYSWWCWCCIW